MSLVVSGLYISICALLLVVLTFRVIKLRRKHKIGVGTNDNRELLLATRVHGNYLENAPIILLLLAVAEANGLAAVYLHCFGTVLVVARLSHAIGLTQGDGGYHIGRFWGTLMTWAVLVGLCIVNISQFIMA